MEGGIFFQDFCPTPPLSSVQDQIGVKLGTDRWMRHACSPPPAPSREQWRSVVGPPCWEWQVPLCLQGTWGSPWSCIWPRAAGCSHLNERIPQVGTHCRSSCWHWERLGKASISCPPVQLFSDLPLMPPWLVVSLAERIAPSTISAVWGRAAAG